MKSFEQLYEKSLKEREITTTEIINLNFKDQTTKDDLFEMIKTAKDNLSEIKDLLQYGGAKDSEVRQFFLTLLGEI